MVNHEIDQCLKSTSFLHNGSTILVLAHELGQNCNQTSQ
jgi:hypothetical protein